jgi:Zn-finger nucleic acid-binding protein
MAEAEAQRCPICGAPVAARAESCDYCASSLLTVRCAECFVLNAADFIHCGGCGRELGLEPLSVTSDLSCPACRRAFSGFAGSAGQLSECTACGGQFVEHALLKELLERREVLRGVVDKPRRANPLGQAVRYLPCPACGSVMNRKNFGESSGIVVDVCTAHGVWFDAGELPRVLAFAQAGGLERARLRRQSEQERVERERRISEALSRPLPVRQEANDLEALGRAGVELIEFLAATLRAKL